MFEYHLFDVEIVRFVDGQRLCWPRAAEVEAETNPGCNRDYQDLRNLSWDDVETISALEAELVARLEAATDLDAEYEAISDELYDDPEGILGLDIGVAATVATLSAAGCIPISSCNGGAYGGHHHENYPVVAFFAKAGRLDLLLECAKEADVGLENDESGLLMLYSNDIRKMRFFADALSQRCRR
ncbi:hypothetical protein [Bradyrhizobium sp. Cp5.3]|uniref:hypothetical protein n=1 Tax=Bradyrhizobium sp. Cp5.3 TaxID=443598 RepID=UPI0004871324|nr:hypothetical protein [Bradyrhizobium sp. Cp5.3]